VHHLVGFLEVVVALVNLLLVFLVVRVPWLWSVLECSPKLVALLGGVVAIQMPRALLFHQVFKAAGGLLRVVFRRALDSRDSVVWLALAIGTRVVVAATALISLLLLSPSAQEVIMSLRWVMELGSDDRSLQRCNGGRDRLGRGR
jgi:hypothetical protein